MIIRIPSCKESKKKKKRKRDVILLQGQVLTSIFPLRKLFSEIHFLPRVIYIYSQVLVRGKIERTNSKKLGVKRWKKFIEVYFLIDSNFNEKL